MGQYCSGDETVKPESNMLVRKETTTNNVRQEKLDNQPSDNTEFDRQDSDTFAGNKNETLIDSLWLQLRNTKNKKQVYET